MHHYVAIEDLNKLRMQNQLCRNCFCKYSSAERLERHQLFCIGKEPPVVTMPDNNKSGVQFKRIGARSCSLFELYFRSVSILEKVHTVRNNQESSKTVVLKVMSRADFVL